MTDIPIPQAELEALSSGRHRKVETMRIFLAAALAALLAAPAAAQTRTFAANETYQGCLCSELTCAAPDSPVSVHRRPFTKAMRFTLTVGSDSPPRTATARIEWKTIWNDTWLTTVRWNNLWITDANGRTPGVDYGGDIAEATHINHNGLRGRKSGATTMLMNITHPRVDTGNKTYTVDATCP